MRRNTKDVGSQAGWAHDIRTHLNILLGAVSVMESGQMTQSQTAEYATMIRRNVLAMLRMINHLLAEDEDTADALVHAQIDGMLLKVAQGVAPYAQDRKIELLNDIEKPLYAVCNPEMLERVLYNLLSNAIKYTPPGGFVYLSAKRHSSTTIRINVADTGPGLGEGQLCALLRPNGGIGKRKGLRLVRKFMAAMNGRLECTSELDKGTTFYLYLNIAQGGGAYTSANEQIRSEELSCLPPPA